MPAAAISVLASRLGLEPTEDALAVSPLAGAVEVAGLRFRGATVSIATNADGEVVSAGPVREVVVESPSFAPQVTKILGPPWLRVDEVVG